MHPSALTAASFAAYPPQAGKLAVEHIAFLRQLPLPLLPILLREISTYDWQFPRERTRLEAQLGWLGSRSPQALGTLTASFAAISLPRSLEAMDWVADPPAYMEQLTATLWSTHQMTAFREAAKAYGDAVPARAADNLGSPTRLAVVVLARSLGAAPAGEPLFGKLRREGVLLTSVDPAHGFDTLQAHVARRGTQAPEPFAHWCIEGAGEAGRPPASSNVTEVSYAALEPARQRLLHRAQQVMRSGRSGPEELRSLLARTSPEQLGLPVDDPVLSRFQLSLLTEGSGTQIFATTFVQWAARECLRRADPETLLLRFTPRQQQRGLNELLSGATSSAPDPGGSLVDANEAAHLTWINLLRLPQPERARFLAWQEGESSAMAIGPGLPRGTTSNSPMNMEQVLKLLA